VRLPRKVWGFIEKYLRIYSVSILRRCMMTKELNAVRTYSIRYTVGNRKKIHEFTTDKPMVAQQQYKYFTSGMAKDMFKVKIVSSGFDGELSHE
jgi:stress-induced morphogen